MRCPARRKKTAATYLTISLVLFMAGRFIGTALLRYLAPAKLLASFAVINLILCAVAIALPGWTGLYALVAASVFMSVMFPTIFLRWAWTACMTMPASWGRPCW